MDSIIKNNTKSETRIIPKNRPLNIGVIGAGGRGKVAWYAHKPGKVNLVGAADVNEEALTEFKEKFGNNVFLTNDYKQLLKQKNIDAIFVSTPDFLHKEHAIAALQAGKDVYLEKPMAITTEDCDLILETAYKTKRKLYLGHNMRHMAFIKKMK